MTEQMNSIESLQTEVNQVKTDLDLLKAETNETIKQTKAESLEQDVSATKEKIKKELDALKGLTDATSLENARKLEAMLLTLETSNTELATLKVDVNQSNGSSATPEENIEENKEENKDEDKEKWDRNRIQRQFDGVTSKEEWKTNTWANIARVAWWIGIVAVWVRGIKKLFGRGKKNKEKKESEDGESTEKKWFWKTWWWKALKILWIWTWGYYLVHGLVTSRWSLKEFFNWDRKEKINPDDLKSWYEKNVDAALKPKYDKFAGMVDEYRKNMWNTDSLWFLEDKENNKVEIPRGAIPAAMDNAYDNVGDILDTNNDILDERWRVGGKIRDLVTTVWWKVVWAIFRSGVGLISGLTSSMFDANWEPNDEFKKWAEKEDLTRDEQVANLLQKYSMVRTYLNDKRKQLTRKYTIDQLNSEWISNPTEEQIEEYELNKDLVEMRVERDFMSKKIAHIDPGWSAVDALELAGILDASVSVETQAILDEVKWIRKEIIPDETIRSRAKASPDVNKDEWLRTELNSVSTKFSAHLKEGILDRNILEWVANAWGILNLDELRNSKADDLEEAIEKLWFGDEVKRFTLENNDFYAKLQSKTLTKADIENFEKTINDYFSLLQQVMLEAQAQNDNESAWSWDTLKTWFMGRMYQLFFTPWGLMIVGVVVINSRWMKRAKRTPIKFTYDAASKPIKGLLRQPIRRVNVPTVLGNKYMKNLSYGNTDMWYKNFIKDFENWKINYKDARYVYQTKIQQANNKRPKANNSDLFESLIREKYSLTSKQMQTLDKHFNNKNITNIIRQNPSVTFVELTNKINLFEDELLKIPAGNGQEFCEVLLRETKFKSISDLDNLTKNINKIDFTALDGLNSKAIKQLAKELGKDTSVLGDATQINKRIKEIKQATENVVETLTAAQKQCKSLIDSQITILERQLKNAKTPQAKGILQKNVDELKPFLSEIKKFPDDEVKALNKVFSSGTDVKHISRILTADDPIALLKKINAATNVTEFESALRTTGKLTTYADELKHVNKMGDVFKEFKSVASGLDDVALLVKQGGKLTDVLRVLSKIPVL